MKHLNISLKEEEGAVLVVCVLMMAILSLLGTAAIQSTVIDTKISKNYKDSVQALYAAESGVEVVLDAFHAGATTDLDGLNGADFEWVWQSAGDIGSDAARITVNSGLPTQAYIYVDGSQALDAPAFVTIYSLGNPDGTLARREIVQTFTTSAQNIINGAINNSP